MNAENTRRILEAIESLRKVYETGFARLEARFDSIQRTFDRRGRRERAAIEKRECP
jgi:hypothetical protein